MSIQSMQAHKVTNETIKDTIRAIGESLPKKFKSDAMYRIRLKQPITIKNTVFRPSDIVQLRGDMAEANRDSILGALIIEE